MLPDDLEDWLTDEGDRVVSKMAESGIASLCQADRAIFEVWVLDTETRNGGVSQYFANRDHSHWDTLRQLAALEEFRSLRAFINTIDSVIADSDDPYTTIINSSVDLEEAYEQHQTWIVTELRAFAA
jgi:hypothetical protein